MFKKILVGVDGSEHSRDAIALARALAAPGSTITLANVHAGTTNPRHAVEPGAVAEEDARSAALLEREQQETGIEAELASVAAPSPGEGLHGYAEENGVDLIIVGSCHRGTLGRVFMGDNARSALNGAPCAVAVASRGYASAGERKGVVGVAYNGSDESLAALAAAREIAAEKGAKVVALEVVAVPAYAYTEIGAADTGTGIDAVLDVARKDVESLEGVEGRAEFGLAGEQLAAFGDELDLLVVGSRGYGPVRRLVVGSTSEYLQRNSRCPLLVLPRHAGGG
ncbi:MAG TPA: universal stress protein [Solirubrobacteraceae bacterium]|nr:universal stress protein [Solirubrobacteraceae bacterium]